MKTKSTAQDSDFVRIKNVEDTALPPNQLEIPFGTPELAPPPPLVDDPMTDLTQLELVPLAPFWRAWALGLLAGLGLGLLIGSRELQDAVSRTLNSLNPWR